ncbi:MAG: helix-turn-helix transcriptional regulator [Gemmatimonadetes bacterium]|jgi:DNA-binding XRE family transcriptional regulator|nr:helix-turn-helix transcriptional regulator [Gemmatimonadota bacterium]
MQAVVKTPRIEVNIKGEIPSKLISLLEEEFGENLQIAEESDEEKVNIFGTDWFQEIKTQTTPGDNLKIYRENHSLTQAKLGELLGGIPRQHISNMERGIRPISIKNARKLAEIFGISPAKFI